MARVHSKDTGPELVVRKALHAAGLRYRLHAPGLPGVPDIVFSSRRLVVFVHGCFWHQHPGCKRARMPRENQPYWEKKLGRNVARDVEVQGACQRLGWGVLIVWECEIRKSDALLDLIRSIKSVAPSKGSPSGSILRA